MILEKEERKREREREREREQNNSKSSLRREGEEIILCGATPY